MKKFGDSLRLFVILSAIGFALTQNVTSSKEVKCDTLGIQNVFDGEKFLKLPTCSIKQSITDRGFIISTPKNSSIKAFDLESYLDSTFAPENIGEKFPELTYLSINVKQIEHFEAKPLRNLPKLTVLMLSGNEIVSIEDGAFDNIPKLETLSLDVNEIETLDSNVFKKLPELKKLSLDSNSIQALPGNIFDSLNKLELLYLGQNQIKVLDENIFEKLVNLKKFIASSNQLETLPRKLFISNAKLEYVNLNENKIKLVSPRIFDANPKLKFVDLSGTSQCADSAYIEVGYNPVTIIFGPRKSLARMKSDLKNKCSRSKPKKATTNSFAVNVLNFLEALGELS